MALKFKLHVYMKNVNTMFKLRLRESPILINLVVETSNKIWSCLLKSRVLQVRMTINNRIAIMKIVASN